MKNHFCIYNYSNFGTLPSRRPFLFLIDCVGQKKKKKS